MGGELRERRKKKRDIDQEGNTYSERRRKDKERATGNR